MELNASVIIAACRAGAEEAARLAPFLDDLDGWDGADCDTGTNAAATMAALAAAMDSLEPRAHLRVALEAGVETLIRLGVGHSGVALAALVEAWAGALGEDREVTPVALRRMLASLRGEQLLQHSRVASACERGQTRERRIEPRYRIT